MKQRCLFVLLLVWEQNTLLRGQDRLGTSNSNYMSTQSIFMNPSSSVDSKTYMQLNLAGVNTFLMSNIVYAKDFSVYGHKNNEAYIQNLGFNSSRLPKFAYGSVNADGPAFVLSQGKYGFGVFVRGRSVVNVRAGSILSASSLSIQDNLNAGTTYVNLKNTKAATMSWLEYGGNFGMMIHRTRNTLLSGGINLRYLSGLNLMYANMTDLSGSYNDSLITVTNMSGKIRFTDLTYHAGRGLGMDIGVTFKKMQGNSSSYYPNSVRCACKTIDYKYKVGVALKDIGFIRFKNTTSSANVTGSGSYYTDRNDVSYLTALEQLSSTSFSDKPILASLPAALVAQLDWNFENHLYVNSTLVKSALPAGLTGVQSANYISVAPRYEWHNFEVSTPFTLQNFIYPLVGLGLRYRTFTIGVDNIIPFLKAKDTYGMGIYFSVGISLFKNPACKTKVRKVDSCPTKTLSKR